MVPQHPWDASSPPSLPAKVMMAVPKAKRGAQGWWQRQWWSPAEGGGGAGGQGFCHKAGFPVPEPGICYLICGHEIAKTV